MFSESKKMKEENDEDAAENKSKVSLLQETAKKILGEYARNGYWERALPLYRNGISNNMIPEIDNWIINFGQKLECINLGGNQITSVGASMLLDTLKTNNSSIKRISLTDNEQIDDKCMSSLGEYIKSNKSIETITLNSTSISDVGIEILAPYLDGNTTFKHLQLSNNKGITDKSIPLLMKMIESSCIEIIGTYNTSITQKSIIYALLACNKIKNGSAGLDLYENYLNDSDLIQICDAMKKYGIDKLKKINLNGNNITSKGVPTLLTTLKECNSIVSILDCSWNQHIDDECMKQLGEYMQDNEYVEELKFGSNKIADKGVEILSEYLIGNTTLKKLDLSNSEGITDASVSHLIEMVKRSGLVDMCTTRTSISYDQQQEIKEAFSIPIEQREIPIKSNTKSAAKIFYISAST